MRRKKSWLWDHLENNAHWMFKAAPVVEEAGPSAVPPQPKGPRKFKKARRHPDEDLLMLVAAYDANENFDG